MGFSFTSENQRNFSSSDDQVSFLEYKAEHPLFTGTLQDFKDQQEKEKLASTNRTILSSYISGGGFSADCQAFVNGGQKTGISSLDELTGGLYAGLYVIGAAPSVGKTTLATQVADHMATAGATVFYFSLEQSRHVIGSKFLARRIHGVSHDLSELETTNTDILRGAEPRKVQSAAEKLAADVGDRLRVYDYSDSVTVESLCQIARDAKSARPVVIVDYIQLLPSETEPRKTFDAASRFQLDNSLSKLTALSLEIGAPLIAISSYNRSSYSSTGDYSAYKESGRIEYDATGAFTLEFAVTNSEDYQKGKDFEKKAILKKEKKKKVRRLSLSVTKNRYGVQAGCISLLYLTPCDYIFEPTEKERTAFFDFSTGDEDFPG